MIRGTYLTMRQTQGIAIFAGELVSHLQYHDEL